MIRVLCLFVNLLFSGQVIAASVSEDPSEARIRDLAAVLRCPVCQSENILDSQASTAKEMVVILREHVAADMSDQQIFDFFTQRYGNYVLLSPPSDGSGRIVWMIPVLISLLGLIVLSITLYRSKSRSKLKTQGSGAVLTETGLKDLEL